MKVSRIIDTKELLRLNQNPEYKHLPVANIGPECLHRLHMAHLKSLRLDQNF